MDHGETVFNDLPLELQVEILKYLSCKDLCQAALADPEWEVIIHRLIGLDVQIKAQTVSKNCVKVYDDLLQINMDAVTHTGIRSCTVGENFSDKPEKYSLKYPFLLKDISFGGPIWPDHIEGLLIEKVPNNLSSLEIMLNSLILPMEGLMRQLRLPKLRILKIKDTGIVVADRKSKLNASHNSIQNIQALLSVRFPVLEEFTIELMQTAIAVNNEEENRLMRSIFSFVGLNRSSLLSLELRMPKRDTWAKDDDLPQLADQVTMHARLRNIRLYLNHHFDIFGNTNLESILEFLKGQRFLDQVTISGDQVQFGTLSRSIVKSSFSSLTHIELTKRSCSTYNWQGDCTLDCRVFENCQSLRSLSCQITRTNHYDQLEVHDAGCTEIGFYPRVVNAKYLPNSLESITLESFAIPTIEMIVLLTDLPHLREAVVLGNWMGDVYGPNIDLLKTVLTQNSLQLAAFGPFKPTRELRRGLDNGDSDDPKKIKITKNCKYIHIIQNNGHYENA